MNAARSTASNVTSARPASMREKSSNELTSFKSRKLFRCAVSNRPALYRLQSHRRRIIQNVFERPEHQG